MKGLIYEHWQTYLAMEMSSFQTRFDRDKLTIGATEDYMKMGLVYEHWQAYLAMKMRHFQTMFDKDKLTIGAIKHCGILAGQGRVRAGCSLGGDGVRAHCPEARGCRDRRQESLTVH